MAKYVLLIQAGGSPERRVSLPAEGRFVIGRKPDCDLSLPEDPNVSGHHCEIVFEGGVAVLRDLDSTNGTRVDGKRITELPLAHGDAFQVGGVRLRFADEEQALPEDDLGLSIDAETLRASRRRGGALAGAFVVLLAAGAGIWFFVLGPSGAARGPRRAPPVETVPGNLLVPGEAHFEGDAAGWHAIGEGASVRDGGPGRSGRGALVFDFTAAEGAAPRFGLAALERRIPVSPGSTLRFQAYVRGPESFRAVLLLRFHERVEPGGTAEAFAPVAAGEPTSLAAAGWRRLEYRGTVPKRAAAVEPLIAVLPPGGNGDSARVLADDLALTTVEEPAGRTTTAAGRDVFVPDPKTSFVRVALGKDLVLAAVQAEPGPDGDPAATALARVLPLPLSLVFDHVVTEVEPRGLRLRWSGAGRLVCIVPEQAPADGGYLIDRLDEDGKPTGFERFQSGRASVERYRALVAGQGLRRLAIRPKDGRDLVVARGAGRLELRFAAAGEVLFQFDFAEEIRQARQWLSRAEDALEAGDPAKALGLFAKILEQAPFYEPAVRSASIRRARILDEARAVLNRLERELETAEVLDYRSLYEDLRARVEEALARYRGSKLQAPLEDLAQRVQAHLTRLAAEEAKRRGERWLAVLEALREGGGLRLALRVAREIRRRCPGTEAAAKAEALAAKLSKLLEDK